MFNDKHQKAQNLSEEAANFKAKGHHKYAISIFSQAAELEKAALDEVPSDKVRTRSILSVSVASLFYKAEMYDEAEIAIFGFIASKSLDSWAETQLRELLPVVIDEKLLSTKLGKRYSGENITLALRGGEIGSGTGPLDLILEKASGFRSLLYRFAEWIGKFPLRRSGNPPKEVLELVQARALEPAPGSYLLEIRLTEPLQLELYEKLRVSPQDVSEILFKFLRCLTNKYDYDKIEELVPQIDYRKALLQLTRNISPGGRRIKEIGIYRKYDDKVQSIYLTDVLPARIKEVIPKETREYEKQKELRGILRALDLNKNFLVLTLHDGRKERCDIPSDMLDDVVGPMVNRDVIIHGPIRTRYGADRLLVEEIELADEGE